MRLNRMFVTVLALSLVILWGGVEQIQAQTLTNPVPATWGAIKAMYGVNDKADAQSIGGVNRYDAFPSSWKFPFRGSYYISVGYYDPNCKGGRVCGGGCDQYHSGKDAKAIDWSLPGEKDFGQDLLAPASGWATFHWGTTGYGNYVTVEAGNGYSYLVAHLDQITLNYCGWVERGQKLGTIGCSGNCQGTHIHFVVYKNGTSVDQNGISGQWDLRVCNYYASGQ